MDINKIADKHYEWLKKMNGTNSNPLEALALITSEIGEAVDECRGEVPTDKLGAELSDIILRTCGLAKQLGIDINSEIRKKMASNLKRGTLGRIK